MVHARLRGGDRLAQGLRRLPAGGHPHPRRHQLSRSALPAARSGERRPTAPRGQTIEPKYARLTRPPRTGSTPSRLRSRRWRQPSRRSRIGGSVTEVTPAYCRVAGLSQFVKLGECVELCRRRRAPSSARSSASTRAASPSSRSTPRCRPASAPTAWRRGFVTLSPHASLEGPHHQRARPGRSTAAGRCGRASAPSRPNASRPRRCAASASARPMQDGRPGHRPLHPAVRRPAHRHLRRLRHRQVDAARHARPRRRASTRSSSRWSASAAARCASSSRMRWGGTGRAPSPSSRPATKAR